MLKHDRIRIKTKELNKVCVKLTLEAMKQRKIATIEYHLQYSAEPENTTTLRMNRDESNVNARHDEPKLRREPFDHPRLTNKLLRPEPNGCDPNILEHPTSGYAYFLVERIYNLFIVYGILIASVWERKEIITIHDLGNNV